MKIIFFYLPIFATIKPKKSLYEDLKKIQSTGNRNEVVQILVRK